MKNARLLLVSFILLFLGSKSFALENLGFCHEYLNENTHEVIPEIKIQLTNDQVLVRGELDPYHEQGMEDQTMWSAFEQHLSRTYESHYTALFQIEPGDKVYVLSKNKKTILYEGFFGEFSKPSSFKIGDQVFETYPNRPRLYKDPGLENLLLDDDEFAKLFYERYPVVVVKMKNPKTDYEPYKRAMRLMWIFNTYPGRFTQVTSKFTYEREYGENIVEVNLNYIPDPNYFWSARVNPEAPTHIWKFQDLNNTTVRDSEIKKVLAFDHDGNLIMSEDLDMEGVIPTLLESKPHSVFLVVR